MARTQSYQAIVLRTIDIGEADRLCILFTKEGGRKAARARSVRKMTSRLGGTLLPYRHIHVELSESDHHATITGAVDRADVPHGTRDFSVYMRLQQGVELLLALTEDDEPLPEVFDLVLQFLQFVPVSSGDPLPAFRLRLLYLMGFLSDEHDDARLGMLSSEGRSFVSACTRVHDLGVLIRMSEQAGDLQKFADMMLADQLQRPLKTSTPS